MGELSEFVEGWDIVSTLGEGSYGVVKLLVNRESKEAVAVKILDSKGRDDLWNAARKEVEIMKKLKHENIVRLLTFRSDMKPKFYIFLEYINGGELFDQIEPDCGMPSQTAQRYFLQLMQGVKYLHSVGVAHRDIKPENLLLDVDTDVLKISDFGMATMFRFKGIERRCQTFCGTTCYAPPEMMVKPLSYSAPMVDVWSCGVVIVAMLVGELPWTQPTVEDHGYRKWIKGTDLNGYVFVTSINITPIEVLTFRENALIRKMLEPNAKKRYSVEEVLKHRWCSSDFTRQRTRLSRVLSDTNNGPAIKRPKLDPTDETDDPSVCYSQPVKSVHLSALSTISVDCDIDSPVACDPSPLGPTFFSYSQPVKTDDMIVDLYPNDFSSSQALFSQSGLTPLQTLVRRFTRFFVSENVEKTLAQIVDACDAAGYNTTRNDLVLPQLTVEVVNHNRKKVIFKVSAIWYSGKTLVEFRLSSGDGLEFKRVFLDMRKRMADLIQGVTQPHIGSQLASSSYKLINKVIITQKPSLKV